MATIAEPFAAGNSLIHRLDPRMRLVGAILLTIPAALLQNIESALFALCVGILLVLLAGLPPGKALKRLAVVNLFIAFLWLFLPFSLPGTPVFSLGPLSATTEGIHLALLITVKSNAIVLSLMALLGTVAVQDLGPAMQQLGIPGKLCHILLFTYRYIFVIHQEYQTMRQAMAARGFKPKTDRHTYRAYAWLVGMLLVRSWDRAERVFGAMRCRGFQGRFYTLAEFTSSWKDTAFIIGILILAMGTAYIELSR